MAKSLLHLSIETDLLEYAKSLNINLSKLFEQVLRQQLDIKVEDKPKDFDLEIEQLKSKIAILSSQKEHEKDIAKHLNYRDKIEQELGRRQSSTIMMHENGHESEEGETFPKV